MHQTDIQTAGGVGGCTRQIDRQTVVLVDAPDR